MWIESAAGVVHYPSPRQAAEVARGLGTTSGPLVALVVGDAAVVGGLDGHGRYALEYARRGEKPYQALSVSLDAVVGAFERFAAGDEARSPSLRWSQVETRVLSRIASGGQRLPEGFHQIAPRLRRGDRPLDIRNEIMAETGLSKLAAAKRVEAVQKLIRSAWAAAGGGALAAGWLAFNVAFNDGGWGTVLLWGTLALAQFAYAGYVLWESRPGPSA